MAKAIIDRTKRNVNDFRKSLKPPPRPAEDIRLPELEKLFRAREAVLHSAEQLLLKSGKVSPGDLIVITIGEPLGKSGGTNSMKIVKVGEARP